MGMMIRHNRSRKETQRAVANTAAPVVEKSAEEAVIPEVKETVSEPKRRGRQKKQ